MKLSPSEICAANRFRKDVDDGIKELCDSIADVGQLQPILINPDYQLIVGERRLRACELLGIDVECVVTTTLDDGAKRIRAERDENHCRKPWTPSEWVAIGKALEAIEKPKAAERKASTQAKPGETVSDVGSSKLDAPDRGRTDSKVAEALGKSKDTYRKAKEVVEAAADESLPEPVRETAKAAVKQMDETGTVDGAYKAVKAAKEAVESPTKKPATAKKQRPLNARELSPIETSIARLESFADRGLATISTTEFLDAISALKVAISSVVKG